jgi:hypothetical protein
MGGGENKSGKRRLGGGGGHPYKALLKLGHQQEEYVEQDLKFDTFMWQNNVYLEVLD